MLSVAISKNINSHEGQTSLEVNASFSAAKITAIYGNSGEGKTTLFNSISGLLDPDKGQIIFNDILWFDKAKKIKVKTQNRNIGYLFQEDSLFPHFTVKQNILFPLSKEEREEIDLDEVLDQVGMKGFAERYPNQLSGGQKQRIAIARALAKKSELLLLDEPFSALDLEIKQKLYKLLLSVKEKMGLTVLVVSHDIVDVLTLCDEVLWIKNHQASDIITKQEFAEEIKKLGFQNLPL
ncbi:MAG: ATP-binding cassette domain-containing protein [Flavobacteriales bacterium]|nr:ATP-binding cassette domain-containing protein [Flavobacteriales bacterium]